MPYTLENVLRDDTITVIERDDDRGLYKFRLGELTPVVTIILYRSLISEETRYERSHAIKTPLQAGPYHQSRLFWDDPAYALHQAIDSITQHYKDAVSEGYTPLDSWLVAGNFKEF